MIDLSIAQALFEGEAVRARSFQFAEEWIATAVQLIEGFGGGPTETTCPEAVFARPFGKKRVVVVQVAGTPAFARPRFRFLVMAQELYEHLTDPFAIADRYPPNWEARESLPDLDWPPEPLPKRTIAELDDILKHGDGPFLLGACQALVDGGKIALQRPGPDPKLLRNLWALLPSSCRKNLWPATFAFAIDPAFDLVVLPQIPAEGIPGYLGEDQARDYPDSRYERQLQIAIESRDQRSLDRLLSRQTSSEVLQVAVTIVLFATGIAAIVKALTMLNVI